ncbi:MAG TPA: flagellar hook-associated protein FlgK [Phycisphaerae bacterium]|nr:flagellar hook-associated protein FlgK [Phycisphaerae bacterium]HNU46736.1 flagellar hook-associated protein FlgK [Phycisphaerae bacterium]
MGLLNSALHIGRTALLSYQSALQVVGSNISSSASPDYTRLRPELDPLQGQRTTEGLQPGAGVTLSAIQRCVDEALENRLRIAQGEAEGLSAQRSVLSQVEAYFDELDGNGLADALTGFFNNLDALQNNPEDAATRDLVLSSGRQVADVLADLRTQLTRLGVDADGQVSTLTAEANEYARQIAELNGQIVTAEAPGRGQATGLRDQRDALLRQLAEIVEITVRVQPDGAVNVYLGSEALVQSGYCRGLTTVEDIRDGLQRTTVRFADTGGEVKVGTGRLGGLLVARDQHAYGRVAALDELAAALIQDVNDIHADGQGLRGFTSLTSANAVADPDAVLGSSAAGLSFPPQHGSFFLTVTDDATNTPVAYRLNVTLTGGENDTTLSSLVEQINGTVTGMTAAVTADNRLSLSAAVGYSFTFGHDGQEAQADTAHILSALGVNTFFTGSDARDIAVNETLAGTPALLAAARTCTAGDGTNGGRLAALDSTASKRLSGATIPGFYEAVVYDVAATAAGVTNNADASSAVLTALQTQRDSISGVNLDEEAISLLKFERAYQGAARYISTVDEILETLMALVG